ncbi:N-acetylneuraminic acid mutarotase [Nitrosomonas communis]|uniref:N-acetylneuraminic acid mutarotase n=2 Tax=Nitrosomonas communis TaxID=44574 RepID=A0A5D3YA47_9PROT|nr:kelch repeat-containing protein [Nitrosomonas communis]TYP78286.1 N-acetylneuraminic acid mutarotase [Nitrosomonas communis]
MKTPKLSEFLSAGKVFCFSAITLSTRSCTVHERYGDTVVHYDDNSLEELCMFTSKFYIMAGIFFLCLMKVSLIFADTFKAGTWTTVSSAPTKRTEVVAATVEGKIYVVGGFNEPKLQNVLKFAISSDVEVYDPVSDSWSITTPLPEGRHHAGIASHNGMLYVIGGFTKSFLSIWHAVPTVYQYNPSTAKWRELAPMPTARGALSVTVYQNRIYAIGGYDGKHNSAAVEIFDPETNSWSSGTMMPTPRDHLAVTAVRSRIYAIGGRSDLDYHHNMGTVEEYDPQTDQWRARAHLPTARSGITAGVINGWIYVLGGESGEGTFATNEAYDPAQDQWHTMAPMPTARHGLGSAVADGRLYVISGGPTPGGSFSQANEVFTPPPINTPLNQ